MLRRLLNGAARTVDRAASRALLGRSATARSRSLAESLGHEERMVALSAIRAAYEQPDYFPEPDLFFPPPAAAPNASFANVRTLAGGRVVDATWKSEFSPHGPGIAARYASHPKNTTAAARLFLHDAARRPAIILVHGYRAGQFALEERVFPVSWLYERGLDVALAVLPFHGVRAEGTRALFPASDPRFTIEGFRQAMLDLRSLVRLLRARGATDVGVAGMSLGGYTTALFATVEPNLAFAVPIIPLASIADAARDGNRLVGDTEQVRLQHEALDAAHRVVSPLARPPRVPPERCLVLAGEADAILPISHAQRLADHFGVPLETFVGGHLLQFGRGQAFRSVGRLLGTLGLLQRSRPRQG